MRWYALLLLWYFVSFSVSAQDCCSAKPWLMSGFHKLENTLLLLVNEVEHWQQSYEQEHATVLRLESSLQLQRSITQTLSEDLRISRKNNSNLQQLWLTSSARWSTLEHILSELESSHDAASSSLDGSEIGFNLSFDLEAVVWGGAGIAIGAAVAWLLIRPP